MFSPINHSGIMVLGFVFLSTTGAEALYSDMGHVGKANIYASWPFVKAALILNYLGQGAWLLANNSNPQMLAMDIVNPFYMMLPEPLRPFAIVLSAVAAIIASQALITGSFSLVSEATRLNLMPHLRIHYPSDTKGQLYIPLVNNIMWIGCIFIVLLFQNSERMESAYGLAITVTMLMTTTLLTSYIAGILKHKLGACIFALLFGAIELCFFASCLTMFFDGGYVMIFLASLLFGLMYVWRRGTAIERTQTILLPVSKYIPVHNFREYSGRISVSCTVFFSILYFIGSSLFSLFCFPAGKPCHALHCSKCYGCVPFLQPFFQAEGRLVGRCEEPRLFINVPDKPVRPLLLPLHIEAAAEDSAGFQHPIGLPISGFFIRERVKAVQRQNNIKDAVRIRKCTHIALPEGHIFQV